MLSGVIAWVGKQGQLSAKPVSLGEGWQLIAQAITEGDIEPRGLGALVLSHQHQCHSISIIKTCPHDQPTSWWLLNDRGCPGLTLRQDSRSETGYWSKIGTEARDNKSNGWLCFSHPCLHQTMDSRVIGAPCQLHHQSHQCLRGQEDQGVCAMADNPTGNQEAMWRSTCQSLKDEDTKDAIMYQSWHWDLTVYCHTRCQDCTLLPYTIHSLQGYPREVVRSSGTDITLDGILPIFDEHYNNVKA